MRILFKLINELTEDLDAGRAVDKREEPYFAAGRARRQLSEYFISRGPSMPPLGKPGLQQDLLP